MTHLEQTASPGTERGRMVVKPLEWGEHHGYHADSIVGTYHVRHDGDEPTEWSWSRNGGVHYYVSSQEEAQTAAQADYERRIFSALESPDLIAAAPTMLEALKDAERMFHHSFAMNGSVHKAMNAAIARAEGRTPAETKGGASDE